MDFREEICCSKYLKKQWDMSSIKYISIGDKKWEKYKQNCQKNLVGKIKNPSDDLIIRITAVDDRISELKYKVQKTSRSPQKMDKSFKISKWQDNAEINSRETTRESLKTQMTRKKTSMKKQQPNFPELENYMHSHLRGMKSTSKKRPN